MKLQNKPEDVPQPQKPEIPEVDVPKTPATHYSQPQIK